MSSPQLPAAISGPWGRVPQAGKLGAPEEVPCGWPGRGHTHNAPSWEAICVPVRDRQPLSLAGSGDDIPVRTQQPQAGWEGSPLGGEKNSC